MRVLMLPVETPRHLFWNLEDFAPPCLEAQPEYALMAA